MVLKSSWHLQNPPWRSESFHWYSGSSPRHWRNAPWRTVNMSRHLGSSSWNIVSSPWDSGMDDTNLTICVRVIMGSGTKILFQPISDNIYNIMQYQAILVHLLAVPGQLRSVPGQIKALSGRVRDRQEQIQVVPDTCLYDITIYSCNFRCIPHCLAPNHPICICLFPFYCQLMYPLPYCRFPVL